MYFPGLISIYIYISSSLTLVSDLAINDAQHFVIIRPFIITI